MDQAFGGPYAARHGCAFLHVGGADQGDAVYLNAGIYGGLVDLRDMGLTGLVQVLGPNGIRCGAGAPRVVFGPTCDSLDHLPDGLALPKDTATGDYVLFSGMGAYSIAMSTRFNGYGLTQIEMVSKLAPSLTIALDTQAG